MTALGRAGEYRADAILLACGCRPAPCPFEGIRSLHRRADAAAAAALRRAFVGGGHRNWVVGGGGETGVQVATQLWRCAQGEGLDRKLFLVERGPALCASMGAGFADYIERQVSWLGVEVMRGTRIVGVDGGDVLLDGDRRVKQPGSFMVASESRGSPLRALRDRRPRWRLNCERLSWQTRAP